MAYDPEGGTVNVNESSSLIKDHRDVIVLKKWTRPTSARIARLSIQTKPETS
jgi:hypothetical protein